MSLLGAMLLDRDIIGLVLQIIPHDESARFYQIAHRRLYEALVELYDGNQPIDIIVLEDELRRREQLESIGGRDYLIMLSESVASSANAEYYARIVRDKALLRDLIQCTAEVTQAAYDPTATAPVVLDEAEKRLFAVTEQRITNDAVSIREFLDQTWEQITNLEEGVLSGVPTGFLELDEMLGGMQYGDFIVIAARPSMGKTAIGLSMLEHIGIDENDGRGFPIAFFSLEMSKIQIAQRMLCARSRVEMHRLRKGTLSEPEITKLQIAMGAMHDRPIFVDDTPGMSVMELRAKARRLKMLHDIKVVFVDYLQLMYDRASRESRQQEISAISRGLKALARELNIPVVAMAQLNRQVESRSGNRPRMSDLRESGAIEQDADVVILLHREEYYCVDKKNVPDEMRGKAELIVEKQRNGPTGVIELHFAPQFTRFDSASKRFLDDESEYRAADRQGPQPGPSAFNSDGPGPGSDGDEEAPF